MPDRDGGRAPVGCLRVADINIIVGKNRTSNRADEHGVVLDAQLCNGFGQKFVD